jgi:hypothetical protein
VVALLSGMCTCIGWALAIGLAARLVLCLRAAQLPACRRCPNFGNHQRRQQVYRRVPMPTVCVCGRILSAAQTVKLPADRVIVDTQQQVFEVINDGDIS